MLPVELQLISLEQYWNIQTFNSQLQIMFFLFFFFFLIQLEEGGVFSK